MSARNPSPLWASGTEGLRAVQGADESLDLGAADGMRGGVPLGLHINLVQAERVLADHAVQAIIAGPAQVLG